MPLPAFTSVSISVVRLSYQTIPFTKLIFFSLFSVVNRNPITGEVLDKAAAPPANGTANGNGTVNGKSCIVFCATDISFSSLSITTQVSMDLHHLCQILQSAFDSHQVSPREVHRQPTEEWAKKIERTKDSTYESLWTVL